MKIRYYLTILIALSMIISSCDEIDKIFNPSSDYLMEKTVKPSSGEQIIESGSDFKMIFPANSITNNLEVKVKKESSAPAMNIPNQKPGKNFYRIKFSGDPEFLHPLKLIINFDKSSIPIGKTAQESVFGYIYSSGSWKLANFELDEPNGKIIISISSILGKTYKDEPILLEDGDIIIGDGYTTTDEGQEDIFSRIVVAFAGKCSMNYEFDPNVEQKHYSGIVNNYYSNGTSSFSQINWAGQNFSTSSIYVYEDTDEWGCNTFNYNISISGILSADGKSIIKVTATQDLKTFNTRGCANNPDKHTITSISCSDIPLLEDVASKYYDKTGNTFMLSGKTLNGKLNYSESFTNSWRASFPNSTDHPSWNVTGVKWDYNVDDLPYVMVKFLK